MLKKQLLQCVSSESMDLSFDGSVMSGDVDVMWESICQVPVSQLVLVCYEPQFIAQIYGPCGSKCMKGIVVRILFRLLVKRIIGLNF